MSELPKTGSREVFEVFIRTSVDELWRELTKTDSVQRPMFNMRMDTTFEVGAPLWMRTHNGRYTGFVGEVLEVDPPRRLAYTFKFTNHDDPPCRIIYELEPEGEGVRFRMISDRMSPDTPSTKAMSRGGHMIVASLKSVMEKGDVPFKTRMLYGLFRLMEPLTPKRLRSENYR